ncbi:arsenite efflux transporter metallochaperone ArsD [Adhaeretor mobilis]|uniref:Arsenical resistance operon trans-acting repressor ArsD n=1 Tax=Adhaeretor mobilis TaxID=1930276 RepID=A0A517MZ27_9BACT|nr:arsenite efflux transporter metallochaperone ArsD [Adhaeretor mobilis]QDT00104.1 Arsenical resistance operon trans-acting repressor ArsD [Adhaeretor mobilis]
MKRVQIYDRAMCCSTGVCGPQIDPVLPKFAADLDWLAKQGHQVDRFNLAQDAAEFAKNESVQALLSSDGIECLPLVIVDGQIVSRSEYPSRENLALWTATAMPSNTASPKAVSPNRMLPIASDSGDCCSDSGCC